MARPADHSERVPPVSIDSSPTPTPEIENLLAEDRKFPPDPAFTAQANATADLYAEAEADPEAFWARLARERIDWVEDFHTTLEWDLPFAKWFVGGKLNIAYNCVDRHVERGLGDKVAYHWIGEPGDTRTITFADLQREVSKAANALLELGRADRRPRRDLHADDPGAADRDAGLRPDRSAAHGGLRWLLRRGAERPDQRLPGQARDHRRRRLAARQAGARSSPPSTRRSSPRRPSSTRSSSAGSATRSMAAPRCRTVATCGGTTSSSASPRAPRAGRARQRAHAVPALHLGHDREAQGHRAHHAPAICWARASPTRWSST